MTRLELNEKLSFIQAGIGSLIFGLPETLKELSHVMVLFAPIETQQRIINLDFYFIIK